MWVGGEEVLTGSSYYDGSTFVMRRGFEGRWWEKGGERQGIKDTDIFMSVYVHVCMCVCTTYKRLEAHASSRLTICLSAKWSVAPGPSVHASVEAPIHAIEIRYDALVYPHVLRPTLQTPVPVQDHPPPLPLLGRPH